MDCRSWPEGSYELGSVHPSIFLFFGSSIWKFSQDWLISFFLKCSMVLGVHVLCVTEPPFWKKIFLPKKMGQKCFFLNLLENLVINFFWIWSIMKVYIICILAQIPYMGKICFLRYGPRCSWPIRLQDV